MMISNDLLYDKPGCHRPKWFSWAARLARKQSSPRVGARPATGMFKDNDQLGMEILAKLVGGAWNMNFICPYIGNNHPNWLSYFSEGLKPPASKKAVALGLSHYITLESFDIMWSMIFLDTSLTAKLCCEIWSPDSLWCDPVKLQHQASTVGP